MVKVRFSASGYGSKMCEYADEVSARSAMKIDAEEVAVEHGGVVQTNGDELVVIGRDGEETARWELIKG